MLCVWLPLNGDLHNQGLTLLPDTSINTFSYSEGKIGQCATGRVAWHLDNEILGNTWSVAMWVKPESLGTANNVLFCKNGTSSTDCHIYFSIISTTQLNLGVNGPSSSITATGQTFTIGTWYHVAATYDGTTATIYLNGVELKHGTVTTACPIGRLNMNINGRSTNAANTGATGYITGSFNDFRLYDHCLSAAEVKEISQGLVLHYKLDNTPQGEIINAYNMSSWNTSATRGGFSAWGPSGHSGTSGNNTDRNYIYRSDRTYSYYISEDAGTGKYFIFYQSPAFEGGYRSLSAIIKEQNGMPINETICVPSWNANVTGSNYAPLNIWTRKISLGNGFYLCQVDGFYQNGSNDLVSINVLPGYKIYISEIWLEDNKQVCSNVLFPIEYIEDSSGYNNNGSILNIVSISSDTPRYSASTNLPDANSKINCGRGGMVTDSITVNFWIKSSSWANPVSCTESGGWNFESDGDYFRFPVNITSVGYKYGKSTHTRAQICNNQWHMLTGVYDRINQKVQIYVDGILDNDYNAGTSNTIKYHASNVIWIGAEATGSATTSNNGMAGLFSDFRIYATALSADDILSLYHTSAKVDNKQNFHTFELVEDNSGIKINKCGQTLCNELEENTATKFYKTNQIIEANEIIEL